jgi:hypothetical protein
MTPNEAYHAMRKIARHAKDDRKDGERLATELLCKLARMTGYYRAADVFEEMRRDKI